MAETNSTTTKKKENKLSLNEAIEILCPNERKKFSALKILDKEEKTLEEWKKLMKKKRLIS